MRESTGGPEIMKCDGGDGSPEADSPCAGTRPQTLDLFTGFGGFALAFEEAGFETRAFAEIEPYPCKVLAQHWPEVPNLGDVREIDGALYRGAVDVVCGGFPCQPHSTAGLRLGEADPRNLWPEVARIIAGCRPAFFLGENVPGLADDFLDQVCADLESLGYSVLPIEIPASAVGSPTIGYRLWILAQANREHGETWMGVREGDARPVQQRNHPALPEVWMVPPPESLGSIDGLPNRLDRIKGVGNSIVPQLALPFARWIYGELMARSAPAQQGSKSSSPTPQGVTQETRPHAD